MKKKSVIFLFLFEMLCLLCVLFIICFIGGEKRDHLEPVKTLGKEYFSSALYEPESINSVYREDLPQKVFLDLKGNQEVRTKPFTLKPGNYVVSVDYSCHTNDNGVVVCEHYDDNNLKVIAYVVPEFCATQSEVFFSVEEEDQEVFVSFICRDEEGLSVFRADLLEVLPGAPLSLKLLSACILWLLLCVAFNVFLFFFVRCKEERKTYLLLLGSVILLSAPFLIQSSGFRCADDLYFHVMRIFGVRDSILQGSVFSKMQSRWYHGYGYPVSACYGDLFLYPSALASIIGIPIEACYRILMILINGISVFSSYYCFKKVFGRRGALVGSITYVFFFYRVIDLFHRGAIGEVCAIAFLPFMVSAVFYLYKDEFGKSLLHFVIGFTALVNSHILTTEMTMIALALFLLVCAKRTFVARRLVSLLTSAAAVVLVNAGFIIPFLDTSLNNDLKAFKTDLLQSSPSEEGIRIENVFGRGVNTMFASAALPVIILLILALFYFFSNRKKESGSSVRNKRIILFSLFALFYIFLSTAYFPWDLVMKIPYIKTAAGSIQFPWRWLAFADLFASLAICEVFREKASEKEPVFIRHADKVLIVSFILIGTLFGFVQYSSFDKVNCKLPESIDWIRVSNHEYQIAGTDNYDIDRKYRTSGDVTISGFSCDGTDIRFSFDSKTDSSIDLPLFQYNHFRADLLDSRGEKIKDMKIERGRNCRIRVMLPENTSGQVKVSFHTPIYWVFSYIISAVSVFVIAVSVIRKRRNQPSGSL